MKHHQDFAARISAGRRRWLVTGAAGFIGSHLVEQLLALDQEVVGLDNFSTGKRAQPRARAALRRRSALGEAALRRGRHPRPRHLYAACASVDVVLHQAGLGSVPRSIDKPLRTHDSNVNGFLNMLLAARDAGAERLVYASSSAVYGDHPALPKIESQIGRAVSPYGLTKCMNELYADVFAACYGFESVGLRYFNVFGPRQDPDGPYASVIPAWIGCAAARRDRLHERRRLRPRAISATSTTWCRRTCSPPRSRIRQALGQAYNVALGEQTTLNELFEIIRAQLAERLPHLRHARAVHREPRPRRHASVARRHRQGGAAARLPTGFRPARGSRPDDRLVHEDLLPEQPASLAHV